MPNIFLAPLFALTFIAADTAVPPAVDLPVNRAVTQETIGSTICVIGWTKTVRPSYQVSNRIKIEKLRQAGLPEGYKSHFELDHLIPLSLGGAPEDLNNLALEPWNEAVQKDEVEACLSSAVCQGKVSLVEAQHAIWEDWRAAAKFCR